MDTKEVDDVVERIRELPGLELKELSQGCCKCERKLGDTGALTFYKIRLERYILDLRAAQRRHGLEQFFGGGGAAAALAGVMDSGDTFAKAIALPVEVLICEECAIHPGPLQELGPKVEEDEE